MELLSLSLLSQSIYFGLYSTQKMQKKIKREIVFVPLDSNPEFNADLDQESEIFIDENFTSTEESTEIEPPENIEHIKGPELNNNHKKQPSA